MATLDIVLLVIIVLSALMGLFRGLFREVVSLATWVAAFVLAMYLAPGVAERLAIANNPTVGLIIGFVMVFAATLIVGGIVQWAIARLVETTGLSGTDRILGVVFGGLRGAVVCIVGLVALQPFAGDADWWAESRLQPELLAFEEDVLDLIGTARATVWEMAGQSSPQSG